MRKNIFKRMLCTVLTAVMVLSLCACGDKEASKNAEANNQAAKQNVYSYADIDLGVDMNNANIQGMRYVNDRLYVLIQDYSGQFGAASGARIMMDMPVVEVLPEEGVEALPEEDVDIGVEEPIEYMGPVYILMSTNMDGSDKKQVILNS